MADKLVSLDEFHKWVLSDGLEYAVLDCFSPDRIEDPTLAALVRQAREVFAKINSLMAERFGPDWAWDEDSEAI